jgi:hypothetical protein
MSAISKDDFIARLDEMAICRNSIQKYTTQIYADIVNEIHFLAAFTHLNVSITIEIYSILGMTSSNQI